MHDKNYLRKETLLRLTLWVGAIDPDKKSTTVEGEQDTDHESAARKPGGEAGAQCVSSPWGPSPWGGATHIPNVHPLHLDLTRHFLTQNQRWTS